MNCQNHVLALCASWIDFDLISLLLSSSKEESKYMGYTPLKDLDSNYEFWRGTRIRMNHHGDMHPDDKFFDYMLVTLPDNNRHMILVNVTEGSHKAGAVYVNKIPIDNQSNKIIVRLNSLRMAFGESFKHCYLMD